MGDMLESQQFYELMQQYRHEPIGAAECVERFEAVKAYIREHFEARK